MYGTYIVRTCRQVESVPSIEVIIIYYRKRPPMGGKIGKLNFQVMGGIAVIELKKQKILKK